MQSGSPPPPSESSIIPPPNYVYWGGENLYVNLTSRCSAACTFCLRPVTWEVFGYDLRLTADQEPTARQVIEAAQTELAKRVPREFVFTGLGEPTLRLREMIAVLEWARITGLRTRLDTNGHGQLLNPGHSVVEELAVAGLTAVSVSLNAPDGPTYERLCRPKFPGAFEAVLAFVRDSVRWGLEVTVTAVDVPGIDLVGLMALATSLGTAFRVRRLITSPAAVGTPAPQ